jgi:predicted nuclease of restriction endonuclease-like (RecB) superfamily
MENKENSELEYEIDLSMPDFALENCWGIPAPHARTGGVLIVAQRRVKHTDTIFYVVRQNRLHPRERVHII